jgi:hypothetical protein
MEVLAVAAGESRGGTRSTTRSDAIAHREKERMRGERERERRCTPRKTWKVDDLVGQ